MKIVLITGLSGAGRSRTADWFEDQGYYCVDNIPPALIGNFMELAAVDTNSVNKFAFVVDARSGDFFKKSTMVIDELRANQNIDFTVLYLEASSKTLVKRYNEVRRKHPLTGGVASVKVIEEEAIKLQPVKDRADIVIDTTDLKISELYEELDSSILGGTGASNFSVNISSFGFKYGIPSEADIMFDVRFLRNPYYVASLKRLTGKNKKVVKYIFEDGRADQFVDSMSILLNALIEGYIAEGKYHINIAFGCTGGHHRSVAVAEALGKALKEKGIRVTLTHRDLDMMAKGK